MIRIDGVSHAYGRVAALRDVGVQVAADRVALLGPNGAGKSTLLGLVTTVLPVQGGTIRVAGHDVRDRRGRASARGVLPVHMQVQQLFTPGEATVPVALVVAGPLGIAIQSTLLEPSPQVWAMTTG